MDNNKPLAITMPIKDWAALAGLAAFCVAILTGQMMADMYMRESKRLRDEGIDHEAMKAVDAILARIRDTEGVEP